MRKRNAFLVEKWRWGGGKVFQGEARDILTATQTLKVASACLAEQYHAVDIYWAKHSILP